MIVGVTREVLKDEYRVALLPVGVEELVNCGHQVLIEPGAGIGSGIADHDYLRHGAEMVTVDDLFDQSDLIVKVKEPQREEWPRIQPNQTIFTYFHFAASKELTTAMIESGATCVAYETLEDANGRLPLLSKVAPVLLFSRPT